MSAHPAAGPAGQLADRGRVAVQDGRDLLERHPEHVVQDQSDPLCGGERVEHDQQGEPDRLGQQRLLLGIRGRGRRGGAQVGTV